MKKENGQTLDLKSVEKTCKLSTMVVVNNETTSTIMEICHVLEET